MPGAARMGLRHASILVVDDEPDICIALKDLLEVSFEARVQVAGSGVEALRILAKGGIDLIITDYKMPGMNGMQFLDKARELAPDVGHILVTAFDRDLVQDLARRGTREAILRKPLEPEQVLKRVEHSLAPTP